MNAAVSASLHAALERVADRYEQELAERPTTAEITEQLIADLDTVDRVNVRLVEAGTIVAGVALTLDGVAWYILDRTLNVVYADREAPPPPPPPAPPPAPVINVQVEPTPIDVTVNVPEQAPPIVVVETPPRTITLDRDPKTGQLVGAKVEDA